MSKTHTLMTVGEVAELLRTTKSAVYHRASSGGIQGIVRLGARLLFDREALSRWIAEGGDGG